MKEQQFISANSNTWRELEELSSIINQKGIKSLPSKDVKKFLHIFRLSSHHLAYARTHYPNSKTVTYLNSLVGKCHSQVYAVQKLSPLSAIKYFSYGFPSILKQYRSYILASFGFFFAGFLLFLLLVLVNTDNATFFFNKSYIDNLKMAKLGEGSWNNPLEASNIMTNNITVSIWAFVLGITLGIGTIYILFINGALLGALTALVYLYNDPVRYWSLILPHGVIELTAIFISGAAGLMIGKSILIPKEHTRLHALIKGSKSALPMVWGIILMLIIAGTIEGFFTPSKVSEIGKLLFAALTAVLLTLYFAIPYLRKPNNAS
ncbi:MAG: stage II sporulation protein M [Clostridiales bacterium]|nr:stage II sporulation protein M [Clostridiales bacterium]